MIELIKVILHRLGLHNWYYGKSYLTDNLRSCVRCGIIQHKGNLSGKWKVR